LFVGFQKVSTAQNCQSPICYITTADRIYWRNLSYERRHDMPGMNGVIGLVKFFRKSEWLDDLINGLFYCNTPEYYRISEQNGVSDLHESCVHAYRSDRGDESIQVKVNGHEITNLYACTLHGSQLRDHWLHCWMILIFPDTDDALEKLVLDINRMRSEFGKEFAFIDARKIPEIAERLAASTPHDISHGHVIYSADRKDWSAGCKPENYAYQREYRFLVGECSSLCTQHKELRYEGGFSDLVVKNPNIALSNAASGRPWFALTPEGCEIDLAAIPRLAC